jgi:heavy metal sensor kinase
MEKKRLMPTSFRGRVIFLYTIVFSLTLIIFGFYLYQDFGRRLNRNIDDLLLSRADGVVDSIENFWEKEKMEAAAKGITLEEIHHLDREAFVSMVHNWVNRRSRDPLLFNIVVTIFDRSGTEVTSTKTMVRSVPLKKEVLEAAFKGQSQLEDLQVEMIPGRLTPFRALTFPVMIDNQVSYLIRLMTPLSSMESTLKELRLILFLILPLAIILSGLSAWFLAGITLRPVKNMINTARLIGAENLQMRLTLPETHDEIRLLAETFNEMLDRLDRTFTSQRQFIEDFSHEIKTPLAIIKGELEVTLKKIRSVKEYENTLHSSLEEIDRIIKVVDELLTLARVEAETLSLSLSPVNLAELVQEVVAEMKVLAESKNLLLDFRKFSEPQVLAEAEKLKRVFINLLDNAIKFTPPGGRVEVLVGQEDRQARVSVSDTGPGLSQEEIQHIFDRFYRGSKDNITPGSGLGLSIARAIVESHRGKIEATSQPGQGAIFVVILPLFPASH